MKTNGVSGVKGTMALMQSQVVGNVVEPAQSFDMVLSEQTENGQCNTMEMENLPEESSNYQVQKTYEKEKSNSSFKEIVSAKTDNLEKNAKVLEENSEAFEEKVAELLTEELGVSKEQLEEAMEALGLTWNDLINGTGLQELMMQLTGVEDMTALLFDERFFNLRQGIEELVNSFSQQLEMSPEELKAALAQLETGVLEEQTVEEVSQKQLSVLKEEQNKLEEEIQRGAAFEEVQQDNALEVLSEQKMDSQMGETSNFSENMSGNLAKSEGTPIQQVTYQQVQTTVNGLGEQVTNIIQQTYVDVDSIMKQISEFTKVTVQQSMSSIEMQLNPEHLGKIYLQVVSKEGMITAQLAAQNESVKQALESQMIILRENMEQQGLKVDAVEITVATHEFQEGLADNQYPQKENTEEDSAGQRRFLTAESLEELSGIMTEEESLIAQIMIDNGNSMDVIA